MRTVFIGAVLLGTTILRAVSAQELRVPDAQLRLRSFLVATYPELAGRPIEVLLQGPASDLVISVRETDGFGQRNTAMLVGRARFSSSNQLRSFNAEGPLLHDSENSQLAADMKRAREQGRDTESEITGRHLRFGPDKQAALVASIQRFRLEETIGPYQVLGIAGNRQVEEQYGFLWSMDLVATPAGQGRKQYVLTIEPFSAGLVSLRER